MSKRLTEATLEKKCRRYDAIRLEIEALEAEREAIRNTLEEHDDDHAGNTPAFAPCDLGICYFVVQSTSALRASRSIP